MKTNPTDICKTLFSLVGETDEDIVAMVVVAQLLKKRGIHADIQQRTVSPSMAPTFAVFMLAVEDEVIGVGATNSWEEAEAKTALRKGITNFRPGQSVARSFDPTLFPADIQQRIASLSPQLEAAMQKIELNDNTAVPTAESRSGPRL